MIIAIDGPAGSGKSSVAREVARRLSLTYLDTGAMYRAVTLLALERGLSLEDDDALGTLAFEMELHFEGAGEAEPRVFVGDQDVTAAIRAPRVSQKVSLVAAHPRVRHTLTLRQREMTVHGDMVLEGRDTGTVVCPTADLKVYLTASAEERARRRQAQLIEQGLDLPLRTLERELLLRDRSDTERALAPLRKAPGALEIDTSAMTLEQVVDTVVAAAGSVSGGGAGMIRSPRDTPFYRVLRAIVPPVFKGLYRTRVIGAEHVPARGAVVLASNHLANIDPFFVGVACPRQVHFMAKAELWRFPPLGWAVEKLGSFRVHRGEADRDAVRTALDYLKAGAVVGIFPEGHRQPEGTLGTPLPGVALLSLRPDVTTVPVVLLGTNHIVEAKRLRFPQVTVVFGPPLPPVERSGSKADQHRELTQHLMGALRELLEGQGVRVRRVGGTASSEASPAQPVPGDLGDPEALSREAGAHPPEAQR